MYWEPCIITLLFRGVCFNIWANLNCNILLKVFIWNYLSFLLLPICYSSHLCRESSHSPHLSRWPSFTKLYLSLSLTSSSGRGRKEGGTTGSWKHPIFCHVIEHLVCSNGGSLYFDIDCTTRGTDSSSSTCTAFCAICNDRSHVSLLCAFL